MAVQLPSDVVADVMRNADPARRAAAANRLQSVAESSGTKFAAEATKFQNRILSDVHPVSADALDQHGSIPSHVEKGVFHDFERFVLRSLFETLLPKEESGSFGSGPSAGVWRSMAAEQLAGVYAEAGGLGIEGMLAASSGKTEMRRDGQWPYFALDSIESFRG